MPEWSMSAVALEAAGRLVVPYVPAGVFGWRCVSRRWRSCWTQVAESLSELFLTFAKLPGTCALPTGLRELRVVVGSRVSGSALLRALAPRLPPGLVSLNIQVEFNGTQRDDVCDLGVLHLASALPGLKHMKQLRLQLSFCAIGDCSLFALAAVLPRQLEMFELHVWACDVTDAGVCALVQRLPVGLTTLRVGVGECAVGDTALLALAMALPPCIAELELALKGHEVRRDDWLYRFTASLPDTLQSLSLKIIDCEVNDSAAQSLRSDICRLPYLSKLNLCLIRVGLTAYGFETIAQLPFNLSSLELYLSGDDFVDVATLAARLPQRLTSLHLSLGRAGTSTASFVALADALPAALTSLHLHCHSLAGKGGKGGKGGKVVKGSGAPMEPEAGEALSRALLRCGGLRALELHVSLGDPGAKALATVLPKRLRRFHLVDATVGISGATALLEALPRDLVHCCVVSGERLPHEVESRMRSLPCEAD